MQNSFSIQLKQATTIICFSFISTLSIAEPATPESIREYFQISGQEAAARENVINMLPMLKQAAGNIPEDLFNELSRTDNLVDRIIPIYQKYFTDQEIKDLISFYKTSTGIKFAKIYGKMQEDIIKKSMSDMEMIVINYYIQKGKFTVDKK